MFSQKIKNCPQLIFFHHNLLDITIKKVSKKSYSFVDFLNNIDPGTRLVFTIGGVKKNSTVIYRVHHV
jgi:hypothetical protein